MRFRQLLPLFWRAFCLCTSFGGSTYFVIRTGVESWPPLMMAGVRFLGGDTPWRFAVARRKLPAAAPDHQRRADWSTAAGGGNAPGDGGGASKRAIGHCCRRGRHCPAIYAAFSYFFGIKTRKLDGWGLPLTCRDYSAEQRRQLKRQLWATYPDSSMSWAFVPFTARASPSPGVYGGARLLKCWRRRRCLRGISSGEKPPMPPRFISLAVSHYRRCSSYYRH